MGVLMFLRSCLKMCFFSFSNRLSPVAGESSLLASFDLDPKVFSFEWGGDFNENLAFNVLTGLGKWMLGLELNFSMFEVTSRVLEVEHS